MNNFTILAKNQTTGDSQLDILSKYGTMCAATDFTILLGGNVLQNFYINKRKILINKRQILKDRTGNWWTNTFSRDNRVYAIIQNGDCGQVEVSSYNIGTRPALFYSSIKAFTIDKVKVVNGIKEIEYGEYPQMVADKDISNKLEKAYSIESLRTTGKEYTSYTQIYNHTSIYECNISFRTRTHTEYEYNGSKYIRFIGDIYSEGKLLSNGMIVKSGNAYWLHVEPIVWLVDEESDIALAKKILFAGVPFADVKDNTCNFKNMCLYRFMNTCFAKEILPDKTYLQAKDIESEEKIQNPYSLNFAEVSEEDIIKNVEESNMVSDSSEDMSTEVEQLDPRSNEAELLNDKDILQQPCTETHEKDENTYMKNKEISMLDGDKAKMNEELSLNKAPKQKKGPIIDELNALLMQITEETIRSKIEQNIEEYLSSGELQKKVSNFILDELDTNAKKKILQIIKDTLQEFNLEREVADKLNETFDKKLVEYASKIEVPVVHIIKLKDTVLNQTEGGFYHEKFEQILSQVQLGEPIMLIGPAGSGKNVAISQVAEALGQHMYYTNNASNEFKLTGFIDAGGNYRETEFYKAFKNGGIFFLDEIDNSDPSALIVINSALANGYMAFPHETIDKHPDFRIIAAANTWGKGADLQYVGRNALDGATLDRFDNIFFDYDTNLERALYPNDEVLQFMWSFRNAVYQSKIPHIVSTRGIGKVYRKEINGIPVQDTLTSNVVKNLGQDDVNTIIGNMQNVSSDNKYYNGIKHLRLSR